MVKLVGYVLEAMCLCLAAFFLARGIFHKISAGDHRKDRSVLGTAFGRYSKENYSVEGWQHLVKGLKNSAYFVLTVLALALVQGIFIRGR